MKRTPLGWLLSIAVLLLGLQTNAFAQRVIRIVVPFGPGAVQDTVARTFSNELGQLLGATVVIDNRAGAGGTIGTASVAKSAPDGNTLVMAAASHTLAGHMYAKLGYDPIKDFAPVSMLGYSGYVIAAPASMGASNLADYIRLVKSKPKQLNYASAGNGSATHLGMASFLAKAGLEMQHIPMKSTGDAVNEVLADLAFGPTSEQNTVGHDNAESSAVGLHRRDHVLHPSEVAVVLRGHTADRTTMRIGSPRVGTPTLEAEWGIGND